MVGNFGYMLKSSGSHPRISDVNAGKAWTVGVLKFTQVILRTAKLESHSYEPPLVNFLDLFSVVITCTGS